MKMLGMFALSLAAVGTFAANSAEEQAYMAILAETKTMKMVGMPEMPELPAGVTLPPGVVLPGKPTRTLSVRLWSPSIAPSTATATLAPPAGLKLGDKLNLDLYRPTPADEAGDKSPGFDPESNPDFTIKMYWGSSDKVKADQPRIVRWGALTPEQKAQMKKQAREAQKAGASYFYKPNWTTGYWPTKNQPGNVAKDASLVGTYSLTTNYTGNVSLDVPQGVDFLAPIDVTAPDLSDEIDFAKAIPFQWKGIPNVLGQYASIMGMEGKNTLILWSSSEVFKEAQMGDSGYLQMAEVRERVKDQVFMAPDQTRAVVPAGIFKNADFVMFNMVGYGQGAALDKVQPLPRVQTKTTLSIMLGGKSMNDEG
jgi:hypothetical protein